jgi:hypothetical protein
MSLYDSGAYSVTYSNLIKSISTLYSYCFYIDFIGKSDILLNTNGSYTSGGHFNTLGYIRVARNIRNITNDVIVDNIGNFVMFGLNND